MSEKKVSPMKEMLITNIRLVMPDGSLKPGSIAVNGDKIVRTAVGEPGAFTGNKFDGAGAIALPGFIDIHIHGAAGADFMDGTEDAYATIAGALPAEGTTAFLATTLTDSLDHIGTAVAAGKSFAASTKNRTAAEMLGFHLEGPFINPDFAGAQPREYIRTPSAELLVAWFGEQMDDLSIVTLAPELDGGLELVKLLRNKGVIASAGHTAASFEDIQKAADAGLSHLTHFANAMTGLHHRHVGAVGAGMLDERLCCEIIADGVHLSPEMLQLIARTIGLDRSVLITDSMRAKGLPDGSYTLGNQQVEVSGNKAILADGTLAGSVLKMNEGLRLLTQMIGLSFWDASRLTSGNAAARLGIADRKGSLKAGYDADIVLLDEACNVKFTFCRGSLSYEYERKRTI